MKALFLLTAAIMLTGCHAHKSVEPVQKHPEAEQVIRAHRIEITDDAGKVRAIVGFRDGASEPEVTLLDKNSNPAATLQLDKREQATMYFSDPNGPDGRLIDGRVSVGYLWGSDSFIKAGEYDPLGSWGVRILTKNRDGYLSLHDLTLADGNEHDLRRFVSPVKVPTKKLPNAHR